MEGNVFLFDNIVKMIDTYNKATEYYPQSKINSPSPFVYRITFNHLIWMPNKIPKTMNNVSMRLYLYPHVDTVKVGYFNIIIDEKVSKRKYIK